MKKLIYSLIFLPLFISCDTVDENDRYIEIDSVDAQRRVLLEEFTGQRCTNCPDAHAIIERLEEQYGDDLVVVSINAGVFSVPSPFGLRQAEGEVYDQYWNVSAYPAGVVDRTGGVTSMDAWATAIYDDLQKPTDLEIEISPSLSADGETIFVTTTLLSSADVKGTLQLWVTENNIVGEQYNGDLVIPDYVHNNVFRACVNGQWGEEVSVQANTPQEIDSSVAVVTTGTSLSKWNVDNLYIVGFVYDDSGVIQANKAKVYVN